jgi:hypothetical protein
MGKKNETMSEALIRQLNKIGNNSTIVLTIIISSAVSSITSVVLASNPGAAWNELAIPSNFVLNSILLSFLAFIGIMILLVIAVAFLALVEKVIGSR